MPYFADLSASAKKELWAVLALRHARGIGVRRAQRLMEHFGSALEAVAAGLSSPDAWVAPTGIPRRAAGAFASAHWRADAKSEWLAIQRHNLSFLLRSDACYPDSLRHIVDAPLLIYYKGDLSLLQGPAVAVVGARNCTREGIAVSAFFARGLSGAGVAVISGMARGIDRSAHLAGMEGPGRSIAVLGTGIDICYPLCNKDLYDLLATQGMLLSEFPPGSGALAAHFPIRNRLISGLSQGVLVVEAADKSGSLITARLALEQNRDVFAVPGHTMAGVSAGCRNLIRLGAKAVFNADDILCDLAPLLTLEAQKALENRQRQAQKKHETVRDTHIQALNSAEEVLPQGKLPWIAESPQPKGNARKQTLKRKTTASVRANASSCRQIHPRAEPVPTLNNPPSEQSSVAPYPAQNKEPLTPSTPAPLSPDERRVIAGLTVRYAHIDSLARNLNMDIAQLSSLLAILEVRGLVRRAPGMRYALP
ncbi:MAG: DNA-processing protein DprA [Desulfovibrio sp.]|nr:DNA-processing protein DprA [Desulfovibrio sp.]